MHEEISDAVSIVRPLGFTEVWVMLDSRIIEILPTWKAARRRALEIDRTRREDQPWT